MAIIPSVADKRKAHFDFAKNKSKTRLERKTDRNDFTSYASTSIIVLASEPLIQS